MSRDCQNYCCIPVSGCTVHGILGIYACSHLKLEVCASASTGHVQVGKNPEFKVYGSYSCFIGVPVCACFCWSIRVHCLLFTLPHWELDRKLLLPRMAYLCAVHLRLKSRVCVSFMLLSNLACK